MQPTILTYILQCNSCGVHGEIEEYTEKYICPNCQGEMTLFEVRLTGDDFSIDTLLERMIESAENGDVISKRTLAFLADNPDEHTRTAVENAWYRKKYPGNKTQYRQNNDGKESVSPRNTVSGSSLQRGNPIDTHNILNKQNISSTTTSVESQKNGNKTFSNQTNSQSVFFPSGVTEIKDRAFFGRTDLTSVVIPNGVTRIGEKAFYNCTKLSYIIIPDSVTEIGHSAFEDCINLVSVTIPKNLTEICDRTFWGCRKLTSLIIPDGMTKLTRIGEKAFYLCDKLSSSIIIPDSVTEIGDSAFEDCKKIPCIVVPKNTEIGNRAFYGCTNVKYLPGKRKDSKSMEHTEAPKRQEQVKNEVNSLVESVATVVPVGTKTIGNSAFAYRTDLITAFIPEGVTRIGNGAFAGCEKLTSVIIPKSVTAIGENAFCGCNRLSSIIISDESELKKIGRCAFYYCKGLESTIAIPDGVTKIEDSTFAGCEKLPSVVIPKSVTAIGENAFCGCYRLSSVIISDESKMTKIGRCAFYYCTKLSSITIPKNVAIDNSAFGGCTCKIKETDISSKNKTVSDANRKTSDSVQTKKSISSLQNSLTSDRKKHPSAIASSYEHADLSIKTHNNCQEEKMKNSIPSELVSDYEISGTITAFPRERSNGRCIAILADIHCKEWKLYRPYTDYFLKTKISVYDEDGDICASEAIFLRDFWKDGAEVSIPDGITPSKVVVVIGKGYIDLD